MPEASGKLHSAYRDAFLKWALLTHPYLSGVALIGSALGTLEGWHSPASQ